MIGASTNEGAGALSPIIVQRWSDFATLGSEWDGLLAASGSGSAFLAWDWIESWRSVHGGVTTPCVIVCRDDDGALSGIAPLIRLRTSLASRVVRILRFMGDVGEDSNNLDFIVRAGREAQVTDLVLSTLESSAIAWDVLELRRIPVESPVLEHLVSGVARRGWVAHRHDDTHLVIDLPHTWSEFLARLSTNTRWRLRRNATLLAELGPLVTRTCAHRDDLAEYLDTLFRLYATRWALRGQRDGAGDRMRRRFYDQLAPRLLDDGRLDLAVLESDGHVVAAQLGLRYGDAHYALQSAFDPAYARFSPSVVLASDIVRRLISNGVRTYDYLHGEEQYKLRWLPRRSTYEHITIVRPGSVGERYLRAARTAGAMVARVRTRFPRTWNRLRDVRDHVNGLRP